jgi:hypothetical protein
MFFQSHEKIRRRLKLSQALCIKGYYVALFEKTQDFQSVYPHICDTRGGRLRFKAAQHTTSVIAATCSRPSHSLASYVRLHSDISRRRSGVDWHLRDVVAPDKETSHPLSPRRYAWVAIRNPNPRTSTSPNRLISPETYAYPQG